jgi:hypothetical protein
MKISNANMHFSNANMHFSNANLRFSNANLHFSNLMSPIFFAVINFHHQAKIIKMMYLILVSTKEKPNLTMQILTILNKNLPKKPDLDQ